MEVGNPETNLTIGLNRENSIAKKIFEFTNFLASFVFLLKHDPTLIDIKTVEACLNSFQLENYSKKSIYCHLVAEKILSFRILFANLKSVQN